MIKKIAFFLPLFVLVLSAAANIVMAAHVSDVGAKTHEYEAKTNKLSAHNEEMLQTLASKQSLASIKDWAISQGFVPHSSVVVIRSASTKIASIAIQ
jgi:hypothetical protein